MKREYWKYMRVVLPYLWRFKFLTSASVALMVLSSLAALLIPLPLAFLVDVVLGRHAPPPIIPASIAHDRGLLIVVAVVAGFVTTLLVHALAVASEYVNTKLDMTTALEFRSVLFKHCQSLSQAFHDDTSTGDFMYRINFEAKAVGAMTVALPPFGQSLLTLVGMFIVALTLDPVLALLSLTIVPFIYYSVEFYGNRIEPRLVAVRTLESASLTIVNTAMSLLRVITAFNRQPHEYDRFRRQGEVAVRARVKLTVQQTLFSLGVAVMTAVGTALVLGIGAAHVLSGALTVGQLLVVMYYIQAIYDPLQTLSYSMSHFQEQLVGIRFASELLDRKPDIVERPGAIALTRAEGDVRFEHVSFTYPGRTKTLVQVNFHAAPGQVVAVVGTTGAGKSTLLSLIPRFIDPKDGGVFIDGHDIRDLTLESVREQVAFVHQEPLLFERSIGDNILYGRLEASPEEIVAAAKAANAHEFIVALPQKYETRLGERGAKISGGERQRIAIARAFLKDAPILILDEPTSSVDSRTEAVILDALERLMRGRTTFIVAHRLSTLRGADWVLVLDDGVIIEQGPPSELLVAGGMYAALQALQAGGGPNPRSVATATGPAAVAWRELVEHGAARNGT